MSDSPELFDGFVATAAPCLHEAPAVGRALLDRRTHHRVVVP